MTLSSTNASPGSSTAQPDHAAAPQPPPLLIERLGPTAYLTFHQWADPADHHLNLVHFAEVHHPVHGRRDVCIKVFPLAGPGRRGLLNEITGWLITNVAQVPQPGFACVLNLPLDKIKAPRGWLREQVRAGRTTWPAYCAERLPWRSAAVQFGRINSEILLQELRQWAHNTMMVAVDEQLGYSDRHFNNLLRAAANSFWAIDFDRLACTAGSADWTIDSLRATHHFDNQLSRRLWSDRPGLRLGNAIVAQAEALQTRFARITHELVYWGRLLITEPEEFAHWQQFVQQRANLVAWLLQRRYGLLHDATMH